MEDNMKKTNHSMIFGFVLLLLCAATTLQAANAPLGNPGKLVDQLQADLMTARSNQLDVLAPTWFNKAQDLFEKAKRALEKGDELSDITKYLAEARLSLNKAEEMAKIAQTILGDTIQARQKALAAGAEKLGEPYADTEKQYLKLTRAIEKNNTRYAQENAIKVQVAFRELEIMAIKAETLQEARALMAQADKAKMKKIAPSAYQDALSALNDADAYVGQNPYDAANNRQKAATAAFMARRLAAVVDASKAFDKMKPEAAALQVEGLLARLSQSLEAGDLRDKSVEDQTKALTAAAAQLRTDNLSQGELNQSYEKQMAFMEQRIAGLKGLSDQQQAAQQRLAAERDFNERFNQVQGFFTASEAEVYKQGDQLVIRMRGINFPVGQAILVSENYALLSKVQKAIQTFGQPKVVIEGHTDSTGSAELNLKLSQERAEAVKAYLVANRTLPSNRIESIGYGPERPLSSNSTPEGRAANRRIDVLITPMVQP
jgi:outer membrane protein OmpA-like peptidoglycan-associated protein